MHPLLCGESISMNQSNDLTDPEMELLTSTSDSTTVNKIMRRRQMLSTRRLRASVLCVGSFALVLTFMESALAMWALRLLVIVSVGITVAFTSVVCSEEDAAEGAELCRQSGLAHISASRGFVLSAAVAAHGIPRRTEEAFVTSEINVHTAKPPLLQASRRTRHDQWPPRDWWAQSLCCNAPCRRSRSSRRFESTIGTTCAGVGRRWCSA